MLKITRRVQAPSKLGGSGDLAQKQYTMTECVNAEIGTQTHSKCVKNKDSYIGSWYTQWLLSTASI